MNLCTKKYNQDAYEVTTARDHTKDGVTVDRKELSSVLISDCPKIKSLSQLNNSLLLTQNKATGTTSEVTENIDTTATSNGTNDAPPVKLCLEDCQPQEVFDASDQV